MHLNELIRLSLAEDIGTGDISSDYIGIDNLKSSAFLIAKEDGVVAGLEVAVSVFRYLDSNINVVIYKKDGDFIRPKDEIMKISGSTKSILKGERVALNFLQRLSGIATITNQIVQLIEPYGVKLLDTRKTTPLLRNLEKYAVRVGGGCNHRFGLYDMIMLKENHIQAVGSIKEAVKKVKEKNNNYRLVVEVTTIKEFNEALKSKVDRIMLDNMPLKDIKKAVKINDGQTALEISGGVNLSNIEKYAATGVNYISSGSITHSVKALDISLLFRE